MMTLLVACPRDLTPCCAREKRALAAKIRHLAALGVRVVALAPRPYPAHAEFARAYSLEFPLEVDALYARLSELGWVSERTWRGKPYRHIERGAALFDGEGKLRAEYRPFDLEHELLRVVADLGS